MVVVVVVVVYIYIYIYIVFRNTDILQQLIEFIFLVVTEI